MNESLTDTPPLLLRTRDLLTMAVPPSLSSLTTYVLLEQEEWFEKEVEFIRSFLRDGMNAIDVGANIGVYSLLMARLVGSKGRVVAYEPGNEARAFLLKSRELNHLENLEISPLALSDSARQGYLTRLSESELRMLGSEPGGDPVTISTLDAESAVHRWSRIDFIKIDAEGEEERVIAGGQTFFNSFSPLVMFEIKAVDKVNESLRSAFVRMGYRVFRQLGGAPILVPIEDSERLDAYELNLFGAKPDRAAVLAGQNLLVENISPWRPDSNDAAKARDFFNRQLFSQVVRTDSETTVDSAYQEGLIAYATWRDPDRPAALRYAALALARRTLRIAYESRKTAERASTWARAAADFGFREEACLALSEAINALALGPPRFEEFFWPPSLRYETMDPQDQPGIWLASAIGEQFEKLSRFSSNIRGLWPGTPWVCRQPFASVEMHRRLALTAARSGLRPDVPKILTVPSASHLNDDVWRAGLVPGTKAPRQ